jgi:hypothetical protein
MWRSVSPSRQAVPIAEGGVITLPKAATYPVFEGYPKRAVSWASAERDRLKAGAYTRPLFSST